MKGKIVFGAAALIVFGASLTVFVLGPGLRMGRANQSLQMGNLVNAQSVYTQLAAGWSGVRQINYNLGLCHYHLGEYEAARDQFKRALNGVRSAIRIGRWKKPDPFLAQVNYQLGNTAVQLAAGKPDEEAGGLYQEALDYYQQTLRIDPLDMEAKYNYELVLQRLSPGQSGSQQQPSPDPQQNPSQTEDYLPETASEESPPVGNDW